MGGDQEQEGEWGWEEEGGGGEWEAMDWGQAGPVSALSVERG